jgi:hypothetical protein
VISQKILLVFFLNVLMAAIGGMPDLSGLSEQDRLAYEMMQKSQVCGHKHFGIGCAGHFPYPAGSGWRS